MLEKLQNSRNALGLIFMLPAAVLLLLFLTYPLGLGVWLGFTDAKVGRPGEWIGLENYAYLVTDSRAFQGSPRKSMYLSIRPSLTSTQEMIENWAS